jgi:membrane fusion protein, multidrug efflux system
MDMSDKQESTAPTAAVPAKPKSKRGNRLLWIAGPALVLAIGGYFYLTSGQYVSTDNAYVQADRVTIAAQVAGRVSEVLVRENQSVKSGDVLFRIDPEPLQIAVSRAQAQLAAVGDLLAASKDQYAGAAADLRSSDATLSNNERELVRQKELRARGLVAQKALDDAGNEVAVARGKRDSNFAALAKSRNMLGGSVNAKLDDISGYKVMQAELAKAQLDLQHATVRAPFDGVIGKQDLQPGSFLNVGQPAMPLVAANSLWVEANFKETDLTHVVVGQKATIEVDTYPGKKWPARVISISPASGSEFSLLPAQNATGNWVKIVQRIPLRLSIESDDKDMVLRPGMSANVEIDTGAQHSILGRLHNASSSPAQVAKSR